MNHLGGNGRAASRSILLLLAGMLAGSVLIQPAVAHVTNEVTHLFKHLDPRYINVEEAASGSLTGTYPSPGLAPNSVGSAQVSDGAVRGSEVANESLTGTDIDESTLGTVPNADTVDGLHASGLIRVGGSISGLNFDIPGCDPGMDYMIHSFNAPQAGFVLANASFTFRSYGNLATQVTARIERTSPSVISGLAHVQKTEGAEDRGNIAMTEVFPVSAGTNTFVLWVCDGSVSSGFGAATDQGQLTFVYSPFAF